MSISSYRKSRIALTVAAAFALGAIAALATLTTTGHRGAHPHPDPIHAQDDESDVFPFVDWDYWNEVNPQIVGWVSIPGTEVSQPIVKPPANDPEYYLTHDVYGLPNFTGCPYIDADCIQEGSLLVCRNSIVYGHNMGWNDEVFGELDSFHDSAFARAHQEVLIQTPNMNTRMKLQAVAVIPGCEHVKRTSFDDEADFRQWWDESFAHATIKIASSPVHGHPLVTLCTCSYSRWQDERTLLYLMES